MLKKLGMLLAVISLGIFFESNLAFADTGIEQSEVSP